MLLVAGLFLAVVGGVYAEYLFGGQFRAEVVACRVERSPSLGRAPSLAKTLCEVRYALDGRDQTGTVEVEKVLSQGDLVVVRVLDDGDVEAAGTSSRFALLLPVGLLLLLPPAVWGWPRSSDQRGR